MAVPGVYNVYNALAAAALGRELGATLDEVQEGLARFRPAFGRFERIAAGDRTALLLLVKNPAGANEAVRTIVAGRENGVPVAVIALNDDIADGRDVSWIWDVDFEPLAACLGRLVAAGGRAEELALRFKYAGFDQDRIEVEPDLGRAFDRGLELTAPGGELIVLPTYTAMLALRDAAASRGLVRPFWEARWVPVNPSEGLKRHPLPADSEGVTPRLSVTAFRLIVLVAVWVLGTSTLSLAQEDRSSPRSPRRSRVALEAPSGAPAAHRPGCARASVRLREG